MEAWCQCGKWREIVNVYMDWCRQCVDEWIWRVTVLSESGGWVNGWTHHNSPNQSSGMAVPSGVQGLIFHTMVGNLDGTDSVFQQSSFQASAHFGIDQGGRAIQWVDVRGGIAWAEVQGNSNWYSCEMADNGDPNNPYTAAQIETAAQLAELLSRPGVGNFPLQVTDSTSGEGLGTHSMGGAAWGGHSCPDSPPHNVRSAQRGAIIARALQIRGGAAPPKPGPPGAYGVTHCPPGQWKGKGVLTGKGSGGVDTWYTATIDGRHWTTPSRTAPVLSGLSLYSVSVPPPGQWKGTIVFGGNGTDNQRWHTSSSDGSTWGGPFKS